MLLLLWLDSIRKEVFFDAPPHPVIMMIMIMMYLDNRGLARYTTQGILVMVHVTKTLIYEWSRSRHKRGLLWVESSFVVMSLNAIRSHQQHSCWFNIIMFYYAFSTLTHSLTFDFGFGILICIELELNIFFSMQQKFWQQWYIFHTRTYVKANWLLQMRIMLSMSRQLTPIINTPWRVFLLSLVNTNQ